MKERDIMFMGHGGEGLFTMKLDREEGGPFISKQDLGAVEVWNTKQGPVEDVR